MNIQNKKAHTCIYNESMILQLGSIEMYTTVALSMMIVVVIVIVVVI